MTKYIPTIGLEIHAELKTETKMFCNSKNDPDETRPNVNVCPICMGHPGTLPTINREAVAHVLKVGTAIEGTLADFTEFDRKNYFYPDIPKGYQISQYKYPLVSGGNLAGVDITRIHLEEDTGVSKHHGTHSDVDFNRAGLPLMELVTEPVIHSAEQAMQFGRELQLLLRYLGVSDANMEKGEMRVEVNISIAPEGSKEFGTKTEVKNINSFRAAGKSIEFEIKRQTALLEAGEEVVQETRGWDEPSGTTISQRKKETSADYRYFPEPDLPKLKISEIPEWQSFEMPELPWERRERFLKLGLKQEDADSFTNNIALGDFFDAVTQETKTEAEHKLAANYIAADVVGLLQADSNLTLPDPVHFAELISMTAGGELSSRGAKDTLKILLEKGGHPRSIAEHAGLMQQNDTEALQKTVDAIVDANQKAVDEYKSGKENALQFLIGQGMKETKGAANPTVLKELFLERLQ